MKRKQYILFGDEDNYDYCIIDTINKLHTHYFYSLTELNNIPINQSKHINNEGRIDSILNNRNTNSFDKIILESDIPITAENYPELLI